MNYTEDWVCPAPNSMYSLNQSHTPFSTNVSNFFRNPAKISKPSSRSTSPRHMSRRKTTSSNVTMGRTKSVMDKQRANIQHHSVPQQRSRPLSWHPNTYADFSLPIQDQYSYNSAPVYGSSNYYSTAAVNGLYTPLAQPIMDEPQIQELITPLEGLSAHEMGQQYDSNAYLNQSWFAHDVSKQQPYAMDNMFPQNSIPQSWQWPGFGQELPTAPSSPNFLPIQGAVEASPLDLNTCKLPAQGDGEELVAMGLYDSPTDVQSSSLLFGGGPPRKRSLKLEEAFEPPSDEEKEAEADDEEEEDDDAEGEEDDDQHTSAMESATYTSQTQHRPVQTSNLAGQSFFFDTQKDGGLASQQQQPVFHPAAPYWSGGMVNPSMDYNWF